MLGLHAEEEGGGEVVDLGDAGRVLLVLPLGQVLGLEVPVQPKGQMPDGSKTLQVNNRSLILDAILWVSLLS